MQKLSELNTDQKKKYEQLKKWIENLDIEKISAMSVDDRNFYLGVQDNDGWTLLHRAARYGSPETITALLKDLTPDQKVKLLRIKDDDGLTPLHDAARFRSPTMITALLEDLNPDQKVKLLRIKNNNRWTPLHLAAESGSPSKITALLEDLNPDQKVQLLRIKDRDKQTPLHVAALSGSPKVITAMLEGLDMTQCRALILGDEERGTEGVVSKLVAEGLTDQISVLIAGINGVSTLNPEDKNALIGGILEFCPHDMEISIKVGTLRQAFGAARNAPGGQDPAATATAVVSAPAAPEQNNGAAPAPGQ